MEPELRYPENASIIRPIKDGNESVPTTRMVSPAHKYACTKSDGQNTAIAERVVGWGRGFSVAKGRGVCIVA